jgi:hypothetical protein
VEVAEAEAEAEEVEVEVEEEEEEEEEEEAAEAEVEVEAVAVEEVGLFQDQAWVSLVGEELGCELGAAESSTLEALHMAVRRMDNSCQHYSHYHYSR